MAGIMRQVDALGRIVIPKEMRDILNIKNGDPLEVFEDGHRILLRRYEVSCIFCDSDKENFRNFKGKYVCLSCWNQACALAPNNEK